MRTLLAALIAAAGHPTSAGRLIAEVWPGEVPPTAASALQVHVSGLRKIVGSARTTTSAGYALDASSDADDFEALAEASVRPPGTNASRHPAGVPGQCGDLPTGRDVEQPYRPVCAGGGQDPAVRAEHHPAGPIGMPGQHGDLAARRDVPQPDHAVGRSSTRLWHAVRDAGLRVIVFRSDSFAFAMDGDGETLAARPGETGWPDRTGRWRVAWFANSGRHRISGEAPLEQQRTTTWYLDPPAGAGCWCATT